MKIAVVHGGFSTEAHYSTENAKCILGALQRKGYNAYLVEYGLDIMEILKKDKPDYVFLCVQGMYHGDGTFQGMLQLLNIPFTGSRMEQAAIINDKVICQSIFADAGLPVAKHFTYYKHEFESENGLQILESHMKQHGMTYPIVSKSPSQGCCIGIQYISSAKRFPAIAESFVGDEQILIESFTKGDCVTVSLLQRGKAWQALPIVYWQNIIASETEQTTYDESKNLQFAKLPQKVVDRLNAIAFRAANVCGARDYCRVDFLYDAESDSEVLLEVNAVPGLRADSLFPAAAKAAGLPYDDLIEQILKNGLQ